MIIDERFGSFINSLYGSHTEFLDELEDWSIKNNIPIIRKDTQHLIKQLLIMNKPQAILEVGAAVGFSSILMAEYSVVPVKITTIENYDKRIPICKDNIEKANFSDIITLIHGDATEVLKELEGQYDLIFMDAAKGQYINFYEDAMKLLKVGGMLLSDNVLQDGDIIKSRFAVTRRNRTIHKRMRDYLYVLTHDDRLVTTILPVGDGMAMSVRVK